MSDTVTERLAEVLRENGVSEIGDGIHSWRCSYPDRYGPCSCFNELLADLAPVVDELVAEAKVEALREAAEQIYNGAGDPEQEFYDRGVAHWLLGRAGGAS